MLASKSFARIAPSVRRACDVGRLFASDINAADNKDAPSVTLFQYAICPFCNKAKSLLAYAGIDYDAVEVNPLTKAELKPW